MNDFEGKILIALAVSEIPADLAGQTRLRIKRERVVGARIRTGEFSLMLVLAAGGFTWATTEIVGALGSSGLLDYFSLLFTDAGTVVQFGQDFFLSILESLPALSFALFFGSVFVILESLKYLAAAVPLSKSAKFNY
ncbi:MAG: hypothetical protein NTY66_04470 [Candidatus Vogelbacteria bacterium]|nr:hypothetical protein [Candidatus Vogelbacteria bacterium]